MKKCNLIQNQPLPCQSFKEPLNPNLHNDNDNDKLHNMADGHVFLAPNADRFFSRPRLVRTSSLPDLSKVYTDSSLVVANRISNQNMSTSVPDYGSLSSSCEMSEMAAIKNALNGRSINSLKVEDLRDELEKRKLSKSGRKTELVKRLKESILTGFGEIQIPRQNVNQPSPRPSAVINLDDTSSSPEQQSHTCDGYKSLKVLYDRLENEVNKLKDSYGSLLTDNRKIQSTCKSCQNQQRIQEENRALREQLQLMKGNLDKTKEERDSLQMVVSLLSKELYFRPDSNEAFKESPSVDPKVSDTKGSDTKADTKQTMDHLNLYLPKQRRIAKANRARKSRQTRVLGTALILLTTTKKGPRRPPSLSAILLSETYKGGN